MPSFIALKNRVITLELLRKIIFLPHYFFAVGWGGGEVMFKNVTFLAYKCFVMETITDGAEG